MSIFDRFFKKTQIINPEPKKFLPKKNLNDLAQFDDIWIKINGTICEGWVTNRENGNLSIVFTSPNQQLEETEFIIERPLDREYLEQGNKVLYLTKEAAYKE